MDKSPPKGQIISSYSDIRAECVCAGVGVDDCRWVLAAVGECEFGLYGVVS